MKEWNELLRQNYGKDIAAHYREGVVDFCKDGMLDVVRGEGLSYDEYLEVQRVSCGKSRRYLEYCYYHDFPSDIRGTIEAKKNGKVLFTSLVICGDYLDGLMFMGKENHVWMSEEGFEEYGVGDSVSFDAAVYRYLKTGNGKLIDFGLCSPECVRRIEHYEVPTDEDLIAEQIEDVICEVCLYYDHCYMRNCIADKKWRDDLFSFLKSLQPGKFTPLTVLAGYEVELHILDQLGGMCLREGDPKNEVMKRVYQESRRRDVGCYMPWKKAIARMMYPEHPRIYIDDELHRGVERELVIDFRTEEKKTYADIRCVYEKDELSIYTPCQTDGSLVVGNTYITIDFDISSKRIMGISGFIGDILKLPSIKVPEYSSVCADVFLDSDCDIEPGVGYNIDLVCKPFYDKRNNALCLLTDEKSFPESFCRVTENLYIAVKDRKIEGIVIWCLAP